MRFTDTLHRIRAVYRRLDQQGWATRSFIQAMSRGGLMAMAGGQVIMVAALLIEGPPPGRTAVLLTFHAAVAACALLAQKTRFPIALVIVVAYLSFLADWSIGATWNGPLLFASCWTANLASALPSMTVSGRRSTAVVLTYAVTFPALMIWTRPDLGPALPASCFVTAVAIVAVFWVGLASPLGFVLDADMQEAAAHERDRLLAAQQAAARRTAEDARLLHDTVINTLGAIANGGSAIEDADEVRARCRHDIETVDALGEGSTPANDRFDLVAATTGLGVTVHHRGLSADDLAARAGELPAGTGLAAQRAVVELVQNVAKHAMVREAVIETAAINDGLRITVSDDGVGFDPTDLPVRGLATSVIDRAAEAGIDVAIDSSRGAGTRVQLTCWNQVEPSVAPAHAPGDAVDSVVRDLLRRAGLSGAWGLAAVGLVLAFTSHIGTFDPDYFMVMAIVAVAALAWVRTRGDRPVGVAMCAGLALGAAAAFVCSAATSDYGRDDVVLWQAIGPVAPLILMSVLSPPRYAVRLAAALYGATVLGVLVVINGHDLFAAANVAIAGIVGLGLLYAWGQFQATVLRISGKAAADQRRAALLRRELAIRTAAMTARRRWQAAGLTRSMTLLNRIAAGTDPAGPDVRADCASEEAYLRQLTQLEPALVRMGTWFAQALAEARTSGALFTVRSGIADLGDDDARALGSLIVRTARTTARGERLTATLFPVDDRVHLTVVAPHERLAAALDGWPYVARYPFEPQRFDQQGIVEIEVRAGMTDEWTPTGQDVEA